jgi:hypothetical protein
MRFLKLLDPYTIRDDGSGMTIGERASAAAVAFPRLVAESPFAYWRAGNPISKHALRLLIGVCPTFDLTNMRLLDLLRDKLSTEVFLGVEIEVFNLDDMGDWSNAVNFFPSVKVMVPNPIVGVWTLGTHVVDYWGAKATAYLLESFRLGVTPSELANSVRPPARDILD